MNDSTGSRKILIGDPSPDEPPPEPLIISALQLVITADRPQAPTPAGVDGVLLVQLKITGAIVVPAIPHVNGLKWQPRRSQGGLPGIRGKLFPWAGNCDCNEWSCTYPAVPVPFKQAIDLVVHVPENTLTALVEHLRAIGRDWDKKILEAQEWAASFREWSVRIP